MCLLVVMVAGKCGVSAGCHGCREVWLCLLVVMVVVWMMVSVLAGVDPTVWVEDMGRELGITQENGRFMNISMGQGQELPAEAAVKKFASSGGWIMLQVRHSRFGHRMKGGVLRR